MFINFYISESLMLCLSMLLEIRKYLRVFLNLFPRKIKIKLVRKFEILRIIQKEKKSQNKSQTKIFKFTVLYCVFQGNRYFATTDNNTVQAYTFPDGTPDGILTRFTAPANHIALNKSGSSLVAGSRYIMYNELHHEKTGHQGF